MTADDRSRLPEADRADLDATVRARGLSDPTPLVINDWKRTATLRATAADGAPVILKWRSADPETRVPAWFEAERRALHDAPDPDLRPTLLDEGDRWLLFAAIPGRSALDAVEAALDAPATTDDVAGLTRRWLDRLVASPVVEPLRRPVSAPLLSDQRAAAERGLLTIHRSLARSGPMRTRRTLPAAAVGRLAETLTRPSLRRLLRARPALATPGWAHGDLHLDNLWLGDDGSVHWLDLATSDPAGVPALDLVYALAATLARLAGHDAERSRVVETARTGLAPLGPVGEDILTLATALARVGATNPRFAPDLGWLGRWRARTIGPLRLAIDATRA